MQYIAEKVDVKLKSLTLTLIDDAKSKKYAVNMSVCMCTYVCVYAYVCMCVCMYVCVCI